MLGSALVSFCSIHSEESQEAPHTHPKLPCFRGFGHLIRPLTYYFKMCKACSYIHRELDESPRALKGRMPRENISTGLSLEQSIALYNQTESWGEYSCTNCNRHRVIHEKSRPLSFAPPILPIYIEPSLTDSYTSFFEGSLAKLESSMAFSSYSEYSLEPSSLKWSFYHLYGVILRFGPSPNAGHYVGAFEQQDGTWLLFDDTADQSVMTVDFAYMEGLQAKGWRIFLLAYRRLFEIPIEDVSSLAPVPLPVPAPAPALQGQFTGPIPGYVQTQENPTAVAAMAANSTAGFEAGSSEFLAPWPQQQQQPQPQRQITPGQSKGGTTGREKRPRGQSQSGDSQRQPKRRAV